MAGQLAWRGADGAARMGEFGASAGEEALWGWTFETAEDLGVGVAEVDGSSCGSVFRKTCSAIPTNRFC